MRGGKSRRAASGQASGPVVRTAADTDCTIAAMAVAMISTMEEGVVFADTAGNVIEANRFFCEFAGRSRAELVGKNLAEAFGPDLAAQIRQTLEAFRGGGEPTCKVLNWSAGQRLAELRLQPIYGEKGYLGVALHLVETSELSRAREQAEAAIRAKDRFLASMSDEIRTPMNAVIGFSELLLQEAFSEEQEEYIKIIKDSANSLLRLLNDMLELSRIEAGKLKVEVAPCSLRQLLSWVERANRAQAESKGLGFELRERGELPEVIHTDAQRLQQCLNSLVGSAVRFTNRGHVCLGVWAEPTDAGRFLRFDVEFTGVGIPPEVQENLFGQSGVGEAGVARRYQGLGLALSLARELAGLLGGRLSFVRQPGEISVYSLMIPADGGAAAQAEPSAGRLRIERTATADGAKHPGFVGRVLVAEDAKTNQLLIELLLRQRGLQVVTVEDGAQAVEKALAEPFDLIMMDMEMPEMDGFEATRTLRARGVRTPIVALTAYAMNGDRDNCSRAGCDDYISKPLDAERLDDVLARYLRPATACVDGVNEAAKTPGGGSSEADAIDWQDLMNRIGDEEVIREVISKFFEDNRDRLGQIALAVERADIEALKFHAHGIRGAAASIGAKRLSEAAMQLEVVAGDGITRRTAELVENIKSEFERVRRCCLSRPALSGAGGQENKSGA